MKYKKETYKERKKRLNQNKQKEAQRKNRITKNFAEYEPIKKALELHNNLDQEFKRLIKS